MNASLVDIVNMQSPWVTRRLRKYWQEYSHAPSAAELFVAVEGSSGAKLKHFEKGFWGGGPPPPGRPRTSTIIYMFFLGLILIRKD